MEKKPEPADQGPKTGADASKVGHTDHGIPPGATDEEPKGMPNSDRHQTEVAPAKG